MFAQLPSGSPPTGKSTTQPTIGIGLQDRVFDIVGNVMRMDGAGWGVGLACFAIAWVIWDFSKKLDPIKITLKINEYVATTRQRLDDLKTNAEQNRVNAIEAEKSINELRHSLEEVKQLQKQNAEYHLQMSGDLEDIEHKLDETIEEFTAKKS